MDSKYYQSLKDLIKAFQDKRVETINLFDGLNYGLLNKSIENKLLVSLNYDNLDENLILSQGFNDKKLYLERCGLESITADELDKKMVFPTFNRDAYYFEDDTKPYYGRIPYDYELNPNDYTTKCIYTVFYERTNVKGRLHLCGGDDARNEYDAKLCGKENAYALLKIFENEPNCVGILLDGMYPLYVKGLNKDSARSYTYNIILLIINLNHISTDYTKNFLHPNRDFYFDGGENKGGFFVVDYNAFYFTNSFYFKNFHLQAQYDGYIVNLVDPSFNPIEQIRIVDSKFDVWKIGRKLYEKVGRYESYFLLTCNGNNQYSDEECNLLPTGNIGHMYIKNNISSGLLIQSSTCGIRKLFLCIKNKIYSENLERCVGIGFGSDNTDEPDVKISIERNSYLSCPLWFVENEFSGGYSNGDPATVKVKRNAWAVYYCGISVEKGISLFIKNSFSDFISKSGFTETARSTSATYDIYANVVKLFYVGNRVKNVIVISQSSRGTLGAIVKSKGLGGVRQVKRLIGMSSPDAERYISNNTFELNTDELKAAWAKVVADKNNIINGIYTLEESTYYNTCKNMTVFNKEVEYESYIDNRNICDSFVIGFTENTAYGDRWNNYRQSAISKYTLIYNDFDFKEGGFTGLAYNSNGHQVVNFICENNNFKARRYPFQKVQPALNKDDTKLQARYYEGSKTYYVDIIYTPYTVKVSGTTITYPDFSVSPYIYMFNIRFYDNLTYNLKKYNSDYLKGNNMYGTMFYRSLFADIYEDYKLKINSLDYDTNRFDTIGETSTVLIHLEYIDGSFHKQLVNGGNYIDITINSSKSNYYYITENNEEVKVSLSSGTIYTTYKKDNKTYIDKVYGKIMPNEYVYTLDNKKIPIYTYDDKYCLTPHLSVKNNNVFIEDKDISFADIKFINVYYLCSYPAYGSSLYINSFANRVYTRTDFSKLEPNTVVSNNHVYTIDLYGNYRTDRDNHALIDKISTTPKAYWWKYF